LIFFPSRLKAIAENVEDDFHLPWYFDCELLDVFVIQLKDRFEFVNIFTMSVRFAGHVRDMLLRPVESGGKGIVVPGK
jgi:hypothetical protein